MSICLFSIPLVHFGVDVLVVIMETLPTDLAKLCPRTPSFHQLLAGFIWQPLLLELLKLLEAFSYPLFLSMQDFLILAKTKCTRLYEGVSLVKTVLVKLRHHFFFSVVKIGHQDVLFLSLLDHFDAVGHYYSLLNSCFLSTNILSG